METNHSTQIIQVRFAIGILVLKFDLESRPLARMAAQTQNQNDEWHKGCMRCTPQGAIVHTA